jgi:hypothetical protein
MKDNPDQYLRRKWYCDGNHALVNTSISLTLGDHVMKVTTTDNQGTIGTDVLTVT